MNKLVDQDEMQRIYDACVKVYNHEMSAGAACRYLEGKTGASEASLKMYFTIYSCMRKGSCYKMGTSSAFTRFLIEKIYQDVGVSDVFYALAAAKLNSDYRISCGNGQPGIEAVCRDVIREHNLPVSYEDLGKYSKDSEQASTQNVISQNAVQGNHRPSKNLKLSISYRTISFEAQGNPEKVLQDFQYFTKNILPKARTSIVHGVQAVEKAQKAKNASMAKKRVVHVGKRIIRLQPSVSKVSEKLDFKAHMIPLLFLAEELRLQDSFTIQDIQQIMFDALGERVEKKQIEDVLSRRAEWFEKINQRPRTYKLLDTAKDYARNILSE